MKYVNEDEKFWKHSYRVHLHEFDTEGILVNADHEQDALDFAVDYAEEQGWEGMFLDPEDEDEETVYAGNHSRPLSSEHIYIEKID